MAGCCSPVYFWEANVSQEVGTASCAFAWQTRRKISLWSLEEPISTPTLNIVCIHSVAVINGLSSIEHTRVHSRPPSKYPIY